MNIEEIIKDLKIYISFANKKENFSKEEEFIYHKNIADRISILLTAYEKEKEKNKIFKEDSMTKEQAIEIIDNMYQNRCKEREIKTEKRTVIDMGIDIEFTEIEFAGVRLLRELQFVTGELEKEKEKNKELKKIVDEINEINFPNIT